VSQSPCTVLKRPANSVSPVLGYEKLPNGTGGALDDFLFEVLRAKQAGQPPLEHFVLVVIYD
jgi:hypothetical protein